MVRNRENNGTEEIGLVTPTADMSIQLVGAIYMYLAILLVTILYAARWGNKAMIVIVHSVISLIPGIVLYIYILNTCCYFFAW